MQILIINYERLINIYSYFNRIRMRRSSERQRFFQIIMKADIIYKADNGTVIYKKQYDRKLWAIKKIPKNMILRNSYEYRLCQKFSKCKSNYLVEVEQAWEGLTDYYIRMKYYKYNLSNYLQKNWRKIRQNPGIGISIFVQILFGLIELEITHRDLKLTNILVEEENDEVKIVISDFGQCNHGQCVNASKVGTDNYMAPEIKFMNPDSICPYSRKVDIWSIGIILWQIFCAIDENTIKNKKQNHQKTIRLPFKYDILEKELFGKQKQGTKQKFEAYFHQNKLIIPKWVPLIVRYLIRYMVQFDPSKRLSLQQIFEFLHENFGLIQQFYAVNKQKEKIYQQICDYAKKGQKNYIQQKLNQQNFIKIKQLYENFYLQLKNINFTQKQYEKISLFMYYGLRKIKKQYEYFLNNKLASQNILIRFIFGGNQQKNEVFCAYYEIKASLNMLKCDEDIQKFYENGSKRILMENKRIKNILCKHINSRQVINQIYNKFDTIYN